VSEASKALLRRYLDAYNRGAMEELEAIVDPGYVHHSNGDALSLEQFKRGAAWIRAGLPDWRVEVADLFAEGDLAAVRFIGRGSHSASMFGEPPTGKTIVLYGTTVYRFAEGRIAEDWEVMDEMDLRRQVGATAG